VAVAGLAGAAGRFFDRRREAAVAARDAVTIPPPASPAKPIPAGAELDVPDVAPLQTPVADFYRIDTALVVPALRAETWSLRVHGMVGRELTLSYADLLARPLIERDVTLTCVSNEVGGNLISSGRWIGAPLAPLLAEARVNPGADQLVSRSSDGFTAGTPVATVLDGRDAMLAVALDGRPLPLEHGFPVRMVVPGLYGYVSATKWLTGLELTTFAAYDAFWVKRGWAARAPIKTESRIDTPSDGGDLAAGPVVVAGVAWAQHRGISRVEVRVDDGPWQAAELAAAIGPDTWRQWRWRWDAPPGPHTLQVRATDTTGAPQTGLDRPPVPDGATGWHRIQVSVH
jgi:DMSO/TMAO reductase YedYZ molybdopterin-dependent catalytic subunit